MEEYIYLDNAATTFPKPEAVYQALDRANRNAAVNAGRGSYALAEQAKQLIEDTRGLLLTLTKSKTGSRGSVYTFCYLCMQSDFWRASMEKEKILSMFHPMSITRLCVPCIFYRNAMVLR